MIEFQYPSSAQWYYAPQIRIKEIGNMNGARVTGFHFDIPGLDAAPSCRMFLGITGGSAVDLFQEIYGDFQLAIFSPGNRSTGGEATAYITVTDGRGTQRRIVVAGPIVPGELPKTYTGGGVAWTCT